MNDLESLQDVFKNRIFRIPDYQRGFSWEDEQLADFWEDVVNLKMDREHYTGMISWKKLNMEDIRDWYNEKWLVEKWGFSAYHIVDGQQRLTTFIILINEIINFYKNLPENKGKTNDKIFINGDIPLSKIIEDYLYIEKPNSDGQLKTFKFGYEGENTSSNYFKERILETNNSGEIEESFYTLKLKNAKEFFARNLKTIDSYDHKEIENLYIKITQKLKFNIYEMNENFNVFVAFETMNNRGKKLSTLELLKNRLIYLTTLFKTSEDIQKEYRIKINNTWSKVYEYLGKNKNKKLEDDDFLRDHWIIYFGYNRNKKNAYNDFLLKQYFNQKRLFDNISFEVKEDEKDLIDETNTSIEINVKEKMKISDIGNYIDSINTIIPYWYDVNNPTLSSLSDDIKEWLDKINNLEMFYFRPLITVVLSKKDISDEKKVEFLKAVERYIFIFFRLANNKSNTDDSHYYGFAKKLFLNKITIDEIIDDLNNIDCLDNENVININIINNNISKYFRDYDGYYDWPALKYFLYEYELHLIKTNQTSQKIFYKDLFKIEKDNPISIEHIYPQTPVDVYWTSRFNSYSEDQRKIMNGSLGNLLPLALHVNIALQNNAFTIKKERYSIGSSSEIEVSKYDEWTPENILAHGKKMLSFMEERWNFKFNDEYDKVILLGLTFLESMPENYNYYEPKRVEESKHSNLLKWKYKGEFYNNASLVRRLLADYINENNYSKLDDLDDEIKNYHIIPILPLLSESNEVNGYAYKKVNGIDFDLNTPSQFNEERMKIFLKTMKKYYDYQDDLIDTREELNEND